MMETIVLISLFILAYILGSVPTSIWIGKWFYDIDVREHGSGNAGATNTIRVLGWKAGLPVFLIDGLKGSAAAMLVIFTGFKTGDNIYTGIQLLFTLTALIGHIFPIFARFKGGKGVATLLGAFIAITPLPALISFSAFLAMLFVFKYVSVGSMVGGISYALVICMGLPDSSLVLKIASVAVAIVLILTHRKNIGRLIRKEESKATFLFKKNESKENKES
jgi:acyl phosphate:glycerol-3-phosphate acyltransferase